MTNITKQQEITHTPILPEGRNSTADFLKGIAVLCMIQVHLTENFAVSELEKGWFGNISMFLGGPLAAPLFMGIMGYFLASSKKSFPQLILRGVKLIVGGLLLNIGLNLHLLFLIYQGKSQINPHPYIFGVDILFLAGLSTLIIALIKLLLRDKYYLYFIIAVAIVLLTPIITSADSSATNLMNYIHSYIGARTSWSYFPLFPWMAYPLTGFAFCGLSNIATALKNISLKIIIGFSGVFAIYLVLSWKYVSGITANLPVYYHHDYIFFIWTISFLSAIIMVSAYRNIAMKNNFLNKFIKWIGVNVTAAYVFQWLIIGNISTALYKTQNEFQLAAWFAAALAAVSALILLWNKLVYYWVNDTSPEE